MDEQKLWSVRFWTLAAALILAVAVLMFVLSHRGKFEEPILKLTKQSSSSVDVKDTNNADEGANAVGIVGPVTNEVIAADVPPMWAIPNDQASDDWPTPDPSPLAFLPKLPAAIPMPRAG